MAMLGGLFGGGGSDIRNASQQALALQQAGMQQAQGAIGTNYANAKGEYGTNYYDPYTASGGQANTMYSNALGLNGAGGNQAAQGAFQSSPGYNFQMQQGTQALDRSAAGKGLFGSGNNAAALTQYGQGLANQDYGNWLSRLQGLGTQGLAAAGGQTARQGSLAGIDTGQGNALANIYTGAANNMASGVNTAANNAQTADAQGINNLLGTLLGGANLGMGAMGYRAATSR